MSARDDGRPAGDQAGAGEVGARIVIRSVGTANAGIVGALHKALPFPEERLAACVYQAPAELVGPLDQDKAEAVALALRATGLEVDVLAADEAFTPGGPDYDVALVIRQFDRLVELVGEIASLLGVTAERARQMLCTCPAELIGKVSANTVDAIRKRLEPLGVTVDASRREGALFDIFSAAGPEAQHDKALRILREVGFRSEPRRPPRRPAPRLHCGRTRQRRGRSGVATGSTCRAPIAHPQSRFSALRPAS
jgi:hypothetical protein